MVLRNFAKALLVTAAIPVVTHASVTLTGMLGYHDLEIANDKQVKALNLDRNPATPYTGQRLNNDIAEVYSIGYEFLPTWSAELEYLQTQALARAYNASNTSYDAREQHYNLNVLKSFRLWDFDHLKQVKPYVLMGGGQSVLESKAFTNRTAINSTTDTIGNLGVGAFYNFNRWFSARGELRAVRNFDHNWWEALGLAGVQFAFPGHTVPTPEVVQYIPPPPPPAPPAPPVDGDDDQDGVLNSKDQCPDTPRNYRVDERGCPRMLTEPLAMRINVLFDTDKWDVKQQYRAEIVKVAEMMKDYPTAKAVIEGHADSSGKEKWNVTLSANRANAIREILVQEFGIDGSRLSSAGFGSSRPIADNKTKAGRALNRRTMAVLSGEMTKVVTKDMP